MTATSFLLLFPYVLVSPQKSMTGLTMVEDDFSNFASVIQVYSTSSRVNVGDNIYFDSQKATQIQSSIFVTSINETGICFLVDEMDIKLVEIVSLN